jgi:HAD superfamily hydrolase (TIGR01509 family)
MPVNGARDFLEKNNKRVFIGSNSMKERILVGLKKIHLNNFFTEEKIFSFDLVKNPKPYPDIYLEVIKKYNLDKNETIIIEDSSVGVQSGVAAGIKVVGFTAGEHWFEGRSKQELIDAGAHCLISSYHDLMKNVDNL